MIESSGTNIMIFVNHPNIHFPKIINDFNNIPICLHIVHGESFEVWFVILILDHCLIDFCPHDLLCVSVSSNYMLQINYNGHDFVICCIIYMASHYCLIVDMLDMVKHDPIFFSNLP